MIKLFYMGGPLFMSILTIELIFLLVAAWKAPAWVKEIGLIALMTGIMSVFTSLYHAFDAIQLVGDISTSALAAGLKVTLIPIIYGVLIYVLSLIIRITQKTKI